MRPDPAARPAAATASPGATASTGATRSVEAVQSHESPLSEELLPSDELSDGGHRRASVDRDAGSGTVLVLAAATVLLLVGMVLTSLAAVGVARHRAGSVADLSALAAAASAHLGSGPACAAAQDVAARSAARLVECRVVGDVADVVAGVRPPGRLGELGEATARARAGPASGAASGASG